MPVDIYAIDLTNAWQSLGDIIGVRYQDELLDTLFSKFCLENNKQLFYDIIINRLYSKGESVWLT